MATPPRQPLVPAQTQDGSIPGDQDQTVGQAASGAPGAVPFGPPAEPGEVGRLGPYRIVKELGRGGMGAVYAALDVRLDRRLALKVMLPQFAADPVAKARFLREARAAARIKHDNVITVYEADERDGVPYIAMEFLEGYSLDRYLCKKGNPTVQQALRMAAEAAGGLAAAHKLGLVHRDVKPANLWLEAPQGRVKVLDFGLARPVDAEAEVTRSGGVVGTPAYMSPEQARGERVDHRTDLFSLGAVLYRLCTGRLPFEGPTTMAVLMALGMREPQPVRELNPAIPASLAALIHQLLAKKADDRPQTADEVMRRLRTISQESAVPRARPAAVQPQAAYAPIQVTSPRPDANPFAGINADATDREAATALAAVPKPARKKWGDKTPWMFAGLAALLAAGVLAGVIIIIKNKDGSETKIEAPDGATVTIKDKDAKTSAHVGPRIKPPAAASDPDRRAAEYVVSLGGSVQAAGLDREFKTAAELPKERFTLACVGLNSPKATDAGLASFEGCKGLVFINLAGTALTDAGLAHLTACKDLWFLNLAGTAVTDAGLAHLKDCKSLRHLQLDGTPVTDAGLVNFKDYEGLGYLALGGTAVTDAGLAYFKNCKSLAHLRIGGTAATDAGLAYFKDFRDLTDLDVRKTPVTARGLEAFHAAVPGCRIEHDGGIIEASDPDRRAAEYVVSLGGFVRVNSLDREIRAAAELPKERFTVAWIDLHNPKATDAGMAAFEGCNGLAYVNLGGAPLTDAGLAHLKAGEGLWFLNLAGTAVTDAGLAHFKDCKSLGHFQLEGTAVTDAGLANFKDCKSVGYLALGGTKVTDAGLANFKNCKNLTNLGLGSTKATDAGLAYFTDCKGLTRLELSNTAATDAGLAYFKDCKGLTEVLLYGTAATDAGLAYFKDCKGLSELEVRKTQVTAKAVEAFHAAVPGCRIDHDGGIIEASDPDRRAAEYVVSLGGSVRAAGLDREFKAAPELPKERFTLAWFQLRDPKATDAGLAAFEGCKGLTYIDLANTAVTDAGLAHLMPCKDLFLLNLPGTLVTDAGLAQYRDCKNLGHLHLTGTKVTDAGLANFKDCKNLGYLGLRGTAATDIGLAYFKDCKGLTRLELHGTAATDAGLAYFKDCKGLTNLDLDRTAVTDAGLAYFKDCKGLTELNVARTRVTAKALEAFHAAVPGCRIEHDGGVIEPKK